MVREGRGKTYGRVKGRGAVVDGTVGRVPHHAIEDRPYRAEDPGGWAEGRLFPGIIGSFRVFGCFVYGVSFGDVFFNGGIT